MPYIGKNPLVGNYTVLDSLTATTTDTYALTKNSVAVFPQTPANCIVSLNGVIQAPFDSYTISGSNIVFASALTASDSIDFITVLGDVLNVGTPSDATVGFSKITSNLITGATAETSIAGGDSILIYDDSASALRKMTRTNFVAGIAGAMTPAFKAYRNGDVSISDFTYTKIQYNTEVYDTNSNYDNATNYRFTPTTAGKYFFVATVFFAGSSADLKQAVIRIEKNGTEASRYAIDHRTSGIGYNASIMTSATLEANGSSDYFEVYAIRDAGGSVNIVGDVSSTYFQAFKLIE